MSWLNHKIALFIFTFLMSFPLMAQKNKPSFVGVWKGVISQDEGYRNEYGMELYLKQDGDKLSGRSFVHVDDIYAEMKVEGMAHSKSIILITDIEIMDNEIMEGMEWCMKNYQLVLKKNGETWHLEGHWQGKTTFSTCVPGKVKLQRLVPRA